MRSLSLLSLLPLAASLPNLKRDVNNASTYEYIVVGGGTSGLVVAKRLSEDPSVSVLVIEAGDSVFSNTNVSDPNGYGLAFGTEIDYAYQTVPQVYAGGAVQTLRAGRALGGTSTINGMAYTRAEVAQIDAWEKLGNDGWNWKTLFPYYIKSEHLQTLGIEREADAHIEIDAAFHGTSGPLLTGWVYGTSNSSLFGLLNTTYQSLSVPYNPDVNGGSMVGFTNYPFTVDQAENVRYDAARAYYYPFQKAQPNLELLLSTRVNKITWKSTGQEATADGVEVVGADGTTRVIKASKEVILSAGSLASPVLLEASGVGNSDILGKFNIATVVDLPTVGENLQDQMNNAVKHDMVGDLSVEGKTSYVGYPSAAQLFGGNIETVAANIKEALPAYAAQVASANGNVTSAKDLLDFFQIQHDLIFTDEIPLAEILVYMSSGAWDSEYWALLPFSRGSIHIGGNGISKPVINPNYFMLDWDMMSQAQSARFIRSLFTTAPLSQYVAAETSPGLSTVPSDGDDEAWGSWIKANYRSNFHPVGTAAMMPREKGGVVDANLKVYGTSNVRVVDASVLPFQVCGHLTSTLYAVAERASDLIKSSA